MKDEMFIDSDNINTYCSDSRQISSALSSIQSSGGGILSGKLLGEGISKLTNNLKKIVNKNDNLTSMVQRFSDDLFTSEASLTDEIRELSTPLNYSLSNFKTNFSGLDKEVDMDRFAKGRSVNDGENPLTASTLEYNKNQKDSLEKLDVVKDDSTTDQVFDVEKENIKNINNGKDAINEQSENNYKEEKININDIAKEVTNEAKVNNLDVNEITLGGVKSEELSDTTTDATYNDNNNSLYSMNNPNNDVTGGSSIDGMSYSSTKSNSFSNSSHSSSYTSSSTVSSNNEKEETKDDDTKNSIDELLSALAATNSTFTHNNEKQNEKENEDQDEII